MSHSHNYQLVKIHSATDVPFRGMAPAKNPRALQHGEYIEASDIRTYNGRIFCRKGIREIPQGSGNGLRTANNLGGMAAPDVGTHPYGVFAGAYQMSTGLWVAAYYESTGEGNVHFYTSTDLSNWERIVLCATKISAYPDYRYTSGSAPGFYQPRAEAWFQTSGMLTFVEISAPWHPIDRKPPATPLPALLVSGETGPPVVVFPTITRTIGGTTYRGLLGFHYEVAPPIGSARLTSLAYFQDHLPISTWFPPDIATNNQSGWEFNTEAGGQGALQIVWRIRILGTPQGSATVDFGSVKTFALAGGTAGDLVLCIHSPRGLSAFLNRFRISLKSTVDLGESLVIWSPSPLDSNNSTFQYTACAVSRKRSVSYSAATYPGMSSLRYDLLQRASLETDSGASSERKRRLEEEAIYLVSFPTHSGVWSTNNQNIRASFLNNISRITFEAVGAAPSGPTEEYRILGLFRQGPYRGGGQWAVTHVSTHGLSESPMVVIPSGKGAMASTCGVSTDWDFEIPEVPEFSYNYHIPITTDHGVDIYTGTITYIGIPDVAAFYRQEPGGTEFYYAGTHSLINYSWSLPVVSSTVSATNPNRSFVRRRLTLTISGIGSRPATSAPYYVFGPTGPLDYSRTAPDESTAPVPTFSAAEVAGDRLYVASGSSLYVSDFGYPTRMRSLPRVTDGMFAQAAGTRKEFYGETLVAIKAVSGSMLGSNQIYVWTNKRMVSIDGVSPHSPANNLMDMGCISKGTLASFKNAVWVVDNYRQYRIYNNGGTGEKSRHTVESILLDESTSFANSTAVWYNDWLHCTIVAPWSKTRTTPSEPGSPYKVPDTILIYDDRSDAWSIDTSLPESLEIAQFVLSKSGSLYAFDRNGRICQMYSETQGDYFSTGIGNTPVWRNITIRLHTREYSSPSFGTIVANRVGILSDPSPGGLAVLSKRVRGHFQPQPTHIPLNPNGWAWSSEQPSTGASGAGVSFVLEADVQPGWELHEMYGELAEEPSSAISV